MRQEKKQKDKPAIVLVLCFCLMALISIFAVKASIDKVKDNMGPGDVADVAEEKAVAGDRTETSANVVDSRENESENTPAVPSDFILPIEGEIIMDYSMDMPIYWETLDQYMTHSGIDIASAAGSDVKACASGTVTKIEEDDKFGMTVEINHGDDIISMYGNLSEEGLIELGEVVSQGDIIGQVGKTSLFEFDSPEHLHFEIRLGDEYKDPSEYIKGL